MMLEGKTILIADDEAYICELFRDLLEPGGAVVYIAHSGSEALQAIDQNVPDLALLDIRMPAPDGLEVLKHITEEGLEFPVIIMTALESSTSTIQAMQFGAYDYIAKPFEPDEALRVMERALEYRQLTHRVRTLEQQFGQKDPRDTLIGRSPPMQQVYKLIGRVVNSDATVLVTGESGTGKEVVARVIHQSSPRREYPFIAVNCAALPETLLESELFGHEKGAFTGAMARRKGRFEQAAKGIIFLDEIGEMSQSTQKKLLRILQDHTFERVGGNVTIQADVRVITATNRDLEAEVAAGNFREDLYYRLNVIHIPLPPLRERQEDIPLLVQHFLSRKRYSEEPAPRISEEALQQLVAYDWPGNVRQLENVIERAVVFSQGKVIGVEHMPLPEADEQEQDDLLAVALKNMLQRGRSMDAIIGEVRIRLITLALQQESGDRVAAARLLGIAEDEL
jgi:DNA-binding NtrC family response regulator